MKLLCECGCNIELEVVAGEEVTVICPQCNQELEGIANDEYIQIGKAFVTAVE